jgi:hypothetical protein
MLEPARQSSSHVVAQRMGRMRLQDGCSSEREKEAAGGKAEKSKGGTAPEWWYL